MEVYPCISLGCGLKESCAYFMALQHKYPLILMEDLLVHSKVLLLMCSLMHFFNENTIQLFFKSKQCILNCNRQRSKGTRDPVAMSKPTFVAWQCHLFSFKIISFLIENQGGINHLKVLNLLSYSLFFSQRIKHSLENQELKPNGQVLQTYVSAKIIPVDKEYCFLPLHYRGKLTCSGLTLAIQFVLSIPRMKRNLMCLFDLLQK